MKAAFFKGTHPGLPGVYSWGVRRMTKSPYSHCELIFSDGVAASSSYVDGGVRFADGIEFPLIDFNDRDWDFIELPPELFDEAKARQWFIDHKGEDYDLLGNLHFVVPLIGDDKHKWFCDEALATALGLPNAWRFNPGDLYIILSFVVQKYQESMRRVATGFDGLLNPSLAAEPA